MMLTIASDLSNFTLSAGEPFLLDVQFLDPAGAVMPLASRAFVLSFYGDGRETVDSIAGQPMADVSGAFVRFARDGRLSEALYGQPVIAELAERYRLGRDVIATGLMTVAASAGGVASLDGGVTGAMVTRVTIRVGADGAAFTQRPVPFDGGVAVPPPAVTLGALSLSGALTAGTASTGTIAGAADGSTLTTDLPGLTIDSAARRYGFDGVAAGGVAGSLTETLAGATGSPRSTTAAIVAAPAPTPTPTPTPKPTDVVLAPYIAGPTNAGTLSSLGYRDTGSAAQTVGARFRRATNTADFYFRMTGSDDGMVFRIIDDDHYRLSRLAGGVMDDVSGFTYRTFAPRLVAQPGTAMIALQTAPDGSAGFYQDGVLVSAWVSAELLDALQPVRGTGVRFVVTVGPAMADVTWGALVAPLAIRSATFDAATRTIDLAIDYSGSPDGYDHALDGGNWTPAPTLSSSAAGQAVVRVPALAAAYRGTVSVALRQRNLPSVTATVTVSV
ncbi:hypothetical protein [Sphingomonas sp. Leaf339]|uniref:hypothetical protein n=1 Tax=Sphingomonas sp. Leaf339 TaxID=1736343 RepID=UPI000A73C1A7|nr:hypothetical protein [Sphingomonas sp. Leaf339]